MSFNFDLGEPFKPFEQLMGVLPEASRELVPAAFRVSTSVFLFLMALLKRPPFQELMFSIESPIIDFYPQSFEQDLNGKKQDWEAIVKIPFIDKRLLQAAMSGGWYLLELAQDADIPRSASTQANP